MTDRGVALEFLRRFCAGDVEGVAALLAEDRRFAGPFHRFDSGQAYVDSLRRDPPEPSQYRVLSVTEGGDGAAVFWEYERPDRPLTIAQLFRIRAGKIREILLVFDGGGVV